MLFFFIGRLSYKAKEIEKPEYINPEIPTVKYAEDYEGLYISVPGIKSVNLAADKPQMELYNPANNNCILVYDVIYENNSIGSSGNIFPGQKEGVNIKIPSKESSFVVKVVAKGISLDGKKEYNSLAQTVEVICV